jgi:hypothetical protein
VASDRPLSELPLAPVEPSPPDVRITWRAGPAPTVWLHHVTTGSDAPAHSLARTAEGFVLRFPGLADFALDAEASQILVAPSPSADPESVRHLLLDQVLPRVLAHRGRLVLHAAAVLVDGRALAFLGPSGQGKSTLAASFLGAGCSLLTDDALVLLPDRERLEVVPTYPGLRLWPQAIAGLYAAPPRSTPMSAGAAKQRLVIPVEGPMSGHPVPLAAVYRLQPEPVTAAPRVERTSARDACMSLITHSFQLDITDRTLAATLLARASDLASRVPMFQLHFPHDFARLPEVRTALLEPLGLRHPGASRRCPGASRR